MLNEVMIKAAHWYHDTQVAVAVLLGAIVQVAIGKNKNTRLILSVALSSVFIALYVVAPVVEYFEMDSNSIYAIALYALSSLLSLEIIGILQSALPRGIKKRLNNFIGVKDDGK